MWLSYTKGKWIEWNPLPGLDTSLGEKALMIASRAYAEAILKGESEGKAQQLAEYMAFQIHYHCKF